MKIEQFHNKNQFLITDDDNNVYFQSYKSIIAKRTPEGKIYLDNYYWDYSRTTRKHRNLFLGETKQETKRKIEEGIYTLTNLNSHWWRLKGRNKSYRGV